MKRHLSKSSRATRALRNSLILFILMWVIFFLVNTWSVEITLYLFGAR